MLCCVGILVISNLIKSISLHILWAVASVALEDSTN